MKKTLITLLLSVGMFVPTAFAFADTLDITPDTIYQGQYFTCNSDFSQVDPPHIQYVDNFNGGNSQQFFSTCQAAIDAITNISGTGQYDLGGGDFGGDQTVRVQVYDDGQADSPGFPYYGDTPDNTDYVIAVKDINLINTLPPTPPPSGDTNGVMSMISSADNGFASTTGFNMAAGVGWAGDNLIKPWAGSGLATLYELRWWIVALLIIASISYFSYRAFRFLNTQ